MLKPLEIKVLPKLADIGCTDLLQGTYELDSVDVGVRHFGLRSGISYDVSLTNTGEAILLTGTAKASLESACDRCLENATTQLTGQVEGYFLVDLPETKPTDGSASEFELVGEGGIIDLAPALLAAVVFELPVVVLCQPDCLGICPRCGQNRNLQSCDCSSQGGQHFSATEDIDPGINPDNPFSGLKDLL